MSEAGRALAATYWSPPEMAIYDAAYSDTIEIFGSGFGIIAHAGFTRRTILVNDIPQKVAGIGFIIVDPLFRGSGFLRKVMNEADQLCYEQTLPYVLLNTGLTGLYERFGYRLAPNLPPGWYVKEVQAVWNDTWFVDLQGTW